MDEKNKFEEIKEEGFESAKEKLNGAIKKAMQSGKNPVGSKTFKNDSGLGVVFSVVEKYFNSFNYIFNGTEFVQDKVNSSEFDVDIDILRFVKEHKKDECNKTTIKLCPEAERALNAFCEAHNTFSKQDIINYLICKGT